MGHPFIAGWFISWKVLLNWMIWGAPILGNLHMFALLGSLGSIPMMQIQPNGPKGPVDGEI